MQWGNYLTMSMKSYLFGWIWIVYILPGVLSYDKIFMGHATIKPGYNFVCHQRTVFNTLGGQIDSRKEYYESGLIHCSIVITSPPGTQIDFRFTDINIIASNLNTCEDASLRIYDGALDGSSNGTSLLQGFPNGICGQAVPSFTIRSTTNSMYLQLMVTSPYTSTFSAIYTAYSPRTSILCFYCGDLCLPAKEQLCDGLDNCRNGEDEKLHECTKVPEQPPPGPPRNQYDEDVKLILVYVFACTSFIFLFIIIGLLLRSRLCRSCLEKRRHRRASAAAEMMLHSYANRTASGNSIPPVSLGPNRPFMAGPTVPTSSRPGASTGRLVPRSDMPPPYSALPTESETRVQQEANTNESQTTVAASANLTDDTAVLDSSSATNSQNAVENQPRNSDSGEVESSCIENQTLVAETVDDSQQIERSGSQEIPQILTDVATCTLDNNSVRSQDIATPSYESSTQTAVASNSKSEASSTEEHCSRNDITDTSPPFTVSASPIASTPECIPSQTNQEHQNVTYPSGQSLELINNGNSEQSKEAGIDDIKCPPKSSNHSGVATLETEEHVRDTGNLEQSSHLLSKDTGQSPKATDDLHMPTTEATTSLDSSGTDNNHVSVSNAETSVAETVNSDDCPILNTSGFQERNEEAIDSSKNNRSEIIDPSNAPSMSATDLSMSHRDTSGVVSNVNSSEDTTDVCVPQPANKIDNTPVEVSTRDIIQSIDMNRESDD